MLIATKWPGCELQSVKMTDGPQIFPSPFKKKTVNGGKYSVNATPGCNIQYKKLKMCVYIYTMFTNNSNNVD